MKNGYLFLVTVLTACGQDVPTLVFKTLDTDFSKGRLKHEQSITVADLEKFHGHVCDGLVVGALAMQQAMAVLYPGQAAIDRSNLRVVSQPSPCLTDVAEYLTGGRYQFGTFYVDPDFPGVYIVQRMDDLKAVVVSLNAGVKPTAIDSLGSLAIQQKLLPCEIDELRKLEDAFTGDLLAADPADIFSIKVLDDFVWEPKSKLDYLKSDVINKALPECSGPKNR